MPLCLQNKEERGRRREGSHCALSPSTVSTLSLPPRHGGLVSRARVCVRGKGEYGRRRGVAGWGADGGNQTLFLPPGGLWDAAGYVIMFSLGWGQGLASSEQKTETERHTETERSQPPIEPLGAYNNLSHPCNVLTTMENRHLHESILQN